jgi:histidyl-tRNA synthetase
LVAYYEQHETELCEDCKRRLKINPLRLLDCKEAGCVKLRENAPKMLDKLCAPCSTHLKEVMEYLEELGVPCTLNPFLVRGLDYYNRTVFEFVHEIGALGGGGRYDYLLETLGAKAAPAVGVGLGIDRIVDALGERYQVPGKRDHAVFVVHAGEKAKKAALQLEDLLIEAGVPVRDALAKDSLKAQLKVADKEGSPLALIVGQKEAFDKTAIIRDFKTGLQEPFPIARIAEEVKRRLKDLRD